MKTHITLLSCNFSPVVSRVLLLNESGCEEMDGTETVLQLRTRRQQQHASAVQQRNYQQDEAQGPTAGSGECEDDVSLVKHRRRGWA